MVESDVKIANSIEEIKSVQLPLVVLTVKSVELLNMTITC